MRRFFSFLWSPSQEILVVLKFCLNISHPNHTLNRYRYYPTSASWFSKSFCPRLSANNKVYNSPGVCRIRIYEINFFFEFRWFCRDWVSDIYILLAILTQEATEPNCGLIFFLLIIPIYFFLIELSRIWTLPDHVVSHTTESIPILYFWLPLLIYYWHQWFLIICVFIVFRLLICVSLVVS